MDPEKIHNQKDAIIDAYIRNELSDQQADIFEEHLLYCQECRDEVSRRIRLVDTVLPYVAKDTLSGGTRENASKSQRWIVYLAAAAGIALVVGLFLLTDSGRLSGPDLMDKEVMAADSSEHLSGQDTNSGNAESIGERIAQAESSEKVFEEALDESFEVHPVYESLIGVKYRNGGLVLNSPADSLLSHPDSHIEFSYQSEGPDSLYLMLMDNKAKILREEKISSPHTFLTAFPRGLYYWQLTNEEEVLYTGKIYIK